jgi:hypothetical protein
VVFLISGCRKMHEAFRRKVHLAHTKDVPDGQLKMYHPVDVGPFRERHTFGVNRLEDGPSRFHPGMKGE